MKKKTSAKKRRQKRIRKLTFSAGLVFSLLAIAAFVLVNQFNSQQIDRILNGGLSGYSNHEIPAEYIPIYQAAGAEFNVPWEVLAAVHRVETKFSTMDPMISPAGAEGPMQFMPCTWYGWSHPTCEDLGAGNIPQEELTDPDEIEMNGGYGIDATGTGIADPWDIEDAIFSAAHYLAANGADNGDLEEALFAYNRADWYVDEVVHYIDIYNADDYQAIE